MINVVRDWIFPIVFGGVALFGLWAVVMAFVVARRQQRVGLAHWPPPRARDNCQNLSSASGASDTRVPPTNADEISRIESAVRWDNLIRVSDPNYQIDPTSDNS